jgi:eukaryotic-like serine/threonine-protein kinase
MQSASRTGHLVAGRYRLLRQLGRGAMGIVWHGRDELLDREVAVKQIVLAPMASEADARESFERTIREARTAARLSHPGVVTVFDVVEEAGMPWIVMELIQARPLDQVIAEDGPLTPAQAAQLGRRLLDALSTAHAAGVLHRDVKPSNVLICPDGKAILSDFGIATIQGDPALTQAGMIAGTPGFSPPERVRGADATPASDLWSLGATLYAAVEGRGPFDRAGGSAAIVASIATEPAPRAPSAGPLAPVIDMLLRADPEQRPDAAAAARMLTTAWTTARRSDRLGPAAGSPAGGRPGSLAGWRAGSVAGWRAGSLAGSPGGPQAGSMAGSKAGSMPGSMAGSPAVAGPEPLDSLSPLPGAEPEAGLLTAAAGLDATTATQIVTVPGPETAAGRSGGAGLAAAAGAAGSPGLAVAAGAAGSPGQPGAIAATSVVPDLMATPVFAELKMPGPATALGEGGTDASAGTGAGSTGRPGQRPGPAGQAAASAERQPASWRSLRTAISSLAHSRRGLVLTAPIAVSALVIGIVFLAFPGFRSLISHLPASSAIGSGPGHGVRLSSQPGTGGHRVGGSAGRQGSSGTPAPAGSHGAAGHPTPSGPSGGPSSPGRTSPSGQPSSTGSPTTSATPSPSPSQTSPTSTGGTPAGYAWKSESAQSLGTTAGFRLAAPAAWLMTSGLQTYITPALGSARLGIDMAQFAVQAPVREARRLQASAITHHRYRAYHLASIVGITFHGWPAASWTFWWKPLSSPRIDVTEIIFTARTSAGPQPYILSMAAPATHAASASHVLRIALRTFTPLP